MSADLEKMAAAFNTTISALEDELMALILDGQIQARIDSHNKVRKSQIFVYLLVYVVVYQLFLPKLKGNISLSCLE